MAWRTRVSGENLYHHVYAWGNNRQNVFKEIYHYRKYLDLLKKYSSEHTIDIIAYALMQWHVHLFIYDRDNHISQFVFGLHGDYAQYFNKDMNSVGHVFGERFNNKIVDASEYCIWLSKYIHRQPLEAGLVKDPVDYPWTSYRQYLGIENKVFIKNDIVLKQFGGSGDPKTVMQYQEFVMNDNKGPVDWNSGKVNITIEQTILGQATELFGLSRRVLLDPRGSTERLRRQVVIVELARTYHHGIRQLAKAFNLAPSTVSRILKDNENRDEL